jgi:acetyltransferase
MDGHAILDGRRLLPHSLVPHSTVEDRIALADGRNVTLRPITADDADAEQRFVRGLSLQSRQMRFHIALHELTPQTLRALTHVDHRCHVAMLAHDADEEVVVADARYVRDPGLRTAEFAIAIADAWQGAGLGRALLQRLMAHAASRGVRRLHGEVLHVNVAMMALVRSLGGRFVAVPGNATVVMALLESGGRGSGAAGWAQAATASTAATLC